MRFASHDGPITQDKSMRLLPVLLAMLLFLVLVVGIVFALYQAPTSRKTAMHADVTIEIPDIQTPRLLEHFIEGLKVDPKLDVLDISLGGAKESLVGKLASKLYATPPTTTLRVASSETPENCLYHVMSKHPFQGAQYFVQGTLGQDSWTKNLIRASLIAGTAFFSICLLCVLSFAVSTSMALQRSTLEVLSLMGSPETYIHRQFQRQMRRHLTRGFILAFLAVGACAPILYLFLEAFDMTTCVTSFDFLWTYMVFCIGVIVTTFTLVHSLTAFRCHRFFIALNTT